MITWHRWVTFHRAEDYLRLGWMPLPSLIGTGHGEFAVHMMWPCACPLKEPRS